MAETPEAAWIGFGPFRLHPSRRILERDGKPIRVGDLGFDILLALLRQPGEIVSQRALHEALWPGRQVDESSLRGHIRALRRALSESSDGTEYVKNVAGRGYFLTVPAAGADAPTPSPARRWRLPRYLTPLIGRDAELAEIGASLALNRLVTLTGMGGIGKTRLAVALGSAAQAAFTDGVCYVDLAPLADPGALASAVAVALEIPLGGGHAGVDAVASAIDQQRVLLIFDNCEHLVEAAAAFIGALLAQAPNLVVLATSQEALHVPGERIFRLGPLALPPDGAADIGRFAAVALFLERVQGADHRFALTDDNTAGIAELCRCLDGVPLVLEMAAARLPLLGIDGLLAGLDARHQILKSGARQPFIRHRSLAAMVDWSYSLLDGAEQQIFHRLAVFSGGFSLEAAVAIAGADDYRDWQVVDILGRLLDKSFLTAEEGQARRYRLLETLRLYAAERLRDCGGFDRLAERHARYFSALFEAAHDAFEIMPEAAWLETYRPELGNVRAALAWGFADPDRGDLAIALAGNSGRLWQLLSLVVEGRRHVDAALALITDDTPPRSAARLLLQAAALHRADQAKSLALAERAAALFDACGDRVGLATVQNHSGIMLMFRGRFAEAEAALDAALAVLAESGRKKTLANLLMNLGSMATLRQDTDKARAAFGQALALARELQHTNMEFDLLHNSAEMEFCAGFPERAIALMREFLPRIRPSDNLWVPSNANMAAFLNAQGLPDAAAEHAARALAKVREAGGYALLVTLLQCAVVAALGGRPEDAARLHGFIVAGFAASGDLWQPVEDQARQRLVTLLHTALGARSFEAESALGAEMTEAAAIACATACLAPQRLR